MAVVQLGRGETCREVGPDRRWQRPEVRNAIKTLHVQTSSETGHHCTYIHGSALTHKFRHFPCNLGRLRRHQESMMREIMSLGLEPTLDRR
ncbi:hypothetical protein DAI22_02g023833 [Oryza sativa Japonica Group]|nr:hypothetical protein DAI22_02g023833 [Oryza sativa Japonica Group]